MIRLNLTSKKDLFSNPWYKRAFWWAHRALYTTGFPPEGHGGYDQTLGPRQVARMVKHACSVEDVKRPLLLFADRPCAKMSECEGMSVDKKYKECSMVALTCESGIIQFYREAMNVATVAHELAHHIVGCEHDHDRCWVEKYCEWLERFGRPRWTQLLEEYRWEKNNAAVAHVRELQATNHSAKSATASCRMRWCGSSESGQSTE